MARRASTPTEAASALPERGAAELGRLLSEQLAAPVEVRFGRSRRAPVACERCVTTQPGEATLVERRLTLHRFFAAADDEIVASLAAWMRSGKRARRASAAIDAFIEAQLERTPPPPIPESAARTRGDVHDLALLSDELRRDPSARAIQTLETWPVIGWGRWPTRAPRRSLQFGSIDMERGWVRIHPVLDADDVPAWFVKSVLYHELLHALIGDESDDAGRASHHGPKFRAAERVYVDYERSRVWQDAHLTRLIRRIGKRLRQRKRR